MAETRDSLITDIGMTGAQRYRTNLSGISKSLFTAAKAQDLFLEKTIGWQKAADSMKRSAMGLGVAAAAMGAGIAAAVKRASQVEELRSKFNVVFKELTGVTRGWVDDQAKQLQRSRFELEKYMSSFQDLFVPLGFARDEAAEMSKALTLLTVDLASFNDEAESDVARKLQGGITGEAEALKRYGIIISEVAMKQELLNMGHKGGVKSATEMQKATARLNIITKSSKDALGDAIRTADSFANQMKGAAAAVDDVVVELGEAFLPMARDAVKDIAELARKFSDLPDSIKRTLFYLTGGAGLTAALAAAGLMLTGMAINTGLAVGKAWVYIAALRAEKMAALEAAAANSALAGARAGAAGTAGSAMAGGAALGVAALGAGLIGQRYMRDVVPAQIEYLKSLESAAAQAAMFAKRGAGFTSFSGETLTAEEVAKGAAYTGKGSKKIAKLVKKWDDIDAERQQKLLHGIEHHHGKAARANLLLQTGGVFDQSTPAYQQNLRARREREAAAADLKAFAGKGATLEAGSKLVGSKRRAGKASVQDQIKAWAAELDHLRGKWNKMSEAQQKSADGVALETDMWDLYGAGVEAARKAEEKRADEMKRHLEEEKKLLQEQLGFFGARANLAASFVELLEARGVKGRGLRGAQEALQSERFRQAGAQRQAAMFGPHLSRNERLGLLADANRAEGAGLNAIGGGRGNVNVAVEVRDLSSMGMSAKYVQAGRGTAFQQQGGAGRFVAPAGQ